MQPMFLFPLYRNWALCVTCLSIFSRNTDQSSVIYCYIKGNVVYMFIYSLFSGLQIKLTGKVYVHWEYIDVKICTESECAFSPDSKRKKNSCLSTAAVFRMWEFPWSWLRALGKIYRRNFLVFWRLAFAGLRCIHDCVQWPRLCVFTCCRPWCYGTDWRMVGTTEWNTTDGFGHNFCPPWWSARMPPWWMQSRYEFKLLTEARF